MRDLQPFVDAIDPAARRVHFRALSAQDSLVSAAESISYKTGALGMLHVPSPVSTKGMHRAGSHSPCVRRFVLPAVRRGIHEMG